MLENILPTNQLVRRKLGIIYENYTFGLLLILYIYVWVLKLQLLFGSVGSGNQLGWTFVVDCLEGKMGGRS